MQKINIHPRRIAAGLLMGIVALTALNLVAQYARRVLDYEWFFGLIRFFSFNQEANLPTWFSVLLLLAASALLLLIGLVKRTNEAPFARHWLGLAAIFLFMATDEAAQVHELFNNVGALMDGFGGLFYWPWVIVALALVLLVAAAYLRFVMHLRPAMRWLVVLAGGCYVFGAVGMEMLGGRFVESYGESTFAYALLFTTEEVLEMSGIVLFLYALMRYVQAAGLSCRLHAPHVSRETSVAFAPVSSAQRLHEKGSSPGRQSSAADLVRAGRTTRSSFVKAAASHPDSQRQGFPKEGFPKEGFSNE